MASTKDDFVVFKDDPADSVIVQQFSPTETAGPPWRIMIVDDDADVHSATEFALTGLQILDRPLEFLHAYSAAEAIDLLMSAQDVAVILLDVVMETEEAGLSAISTIRTDLGLTNTQIILRTGQPGYAPELETIRRYDINDYRTKSELSRVKLYTALTASIRAYSQLRRLQQASGGYELVMRTAADMLAASTPQEAMNRLLVRAIELLTGTSDGFVCTAPADASAPQLVAASGLYATASGHPLDHPALDQPSNVRERVATAIHERHTLFDKDAYTLYLAAANGPALIVYLAKADGAPRHDRQLINIFCSNVALCANNLALVERLADIAYRDPLTGLATRRAFVDELNRRLASDKRDEIALMLLDIDQFAETNDMFGHKCGDELLQGIGERLHRSLPSEVFIARLAADTFALLGTPRQLATESIKALFTPPFVFEGEERLVSISSSYVLASEAEQGAAGNDLLKDASIVIKRAKAQGLGRHIAYTPEFREETRTHSRTLHELGGAFRRNELFLMYQPQISLADRKPIGVEALLRWRKADGSFIPPDRFIPIAETSGLIKPIGNWVLTQAVIALQELQRQGHLNIRMAVNVSAKQLSGDNFLTHLDATLNGSGINPATLELEVTESASILGYDEMHQCLSAFRARGVEVAIDDFGTGYSSLSYLDRLPANRLKIDRAFVSALAPGNAGPRIAEMVIPLGQQLGMRVLAEGVETEDQAKLLHDMGCHEAQGYLFARPMTFDNLIVWLQEHSN